MTEASEDKKKSHKKIIFAIVVMILIIVAIAGGAFGFYKYQNHQSLLKNPEKAKANEAQSLVATVGKLTKLPNETPAIATVSDIAKLAGQSLFKNAQNGDKVLIFSKAKKAVIYRPSTNQVIDIGNIVVSPNANPTTTGATPTAGQKVAVVIYNGTKTAGYAKTVGNDLVSKFPNIEIGSATNASSNYQKTLVIDISGKNKALASSLATQLSGEVGSLPTGEEKPANADILIILGK